MIELDINPNFEAKRFIARRNKSLAEIISECESAVDRKIRHLRETDRQEALQLGDLVDIFLCCYYSIGEQAAKKRIFSSEKSEDEASLTRIYSIYSSSKAVLNQLNNDLIDRLRSQEINPPGFQIGYSDIVQQSDYSVLYNVFSELKDVGSGKSALGLRYSYFSFFNRLKELSRNYLNSVCSKNTKEILNAVRLYKTGLDFKEIPSPLKREFQSRGREEASVEMGEGLPNSLPFYEPDKRAVLSKVIGNRKGIEKLLAAIIRLRKFDAQSGSNPFNSNGTQFDDAFLVHGPPGVGKTYTVDAILNRFASSFGSYGEVNFVNLSSGIKSHYYDKKSQIFERYIHMMRDSDRPGIGIIDEADGIFPVDEKGEMHEETKKLLREMKSAINSNGRGNSIYIFMTNYPGQFEAALKHRFTPIEFQGATGPEEFAQLFRQELGHISAMLSDDQILMLGKKIHGYRLELGNGNNYNKKLKDRVYITGRTVNKICRPIVSGDDRIVIANEDIIMNASYSQTLALIPSLSKMAGYDTIDKAIDYHIGELVRSCKNHC